MKVQKITTQIGFLVKLDQEELQMIEQIINTYAEEHFVDFLDEGEVVYKLLEKFMQ